MICNHCNREIEEHHQFCPFCGEKVAPEAEKSEETVKSYRLNEEGDFRDSDGSIDRDIILTHLEDLRALEIIKMHLLDKMNRNVQRIQSLCFPKFIKKPSGGVLAAKLIFIPFLLFFFSAIVIFVFSTNRNTPFSFYDELGIGVSWLISLIIALVAAILIVVKHAFDMKAYHGKLAEDEARLSAENEQRNQLLAKNVQYNTELNEINKMLDSTYAINLVPAPLRNISGVMYLYDYMNSSYESFQSAILNYNFNRLNQNINRNMNMIAEQQRIMIMEQYQTNMNLRKSHKQNEEMLRRLNAIEQNSQRTAQYTRALRANSAMQTYFQWDIWRKIDR